MKPSASLLGLVLLVCSVFAPATVSRAAFDPLGQIAQANALYGQKQYAAAIALYEQAAAAGAHNAYLYYNLGNACFRDGNIGAAILNYQRAVRLAPRSADIAANFRHAVFATEDKILETKASLAQNIFFWVDFFNARELVTATAWLNLLFWGCMLVLRLHPAAPIGAARNILLCLLLLSTVSAAVKWDLETSSRVGVVQSQEAEVKSAGGMDNVTLFKLHAGAIAAITGEKEGWYQIELPDRKRGWLPKDTVGLV